MKPAQSRKSHATRRAQSNRKLNLYVTRHTYFIPIYAVIALFVHTIQYLDEREVKTDLLLFDLAVGYFARMELLTGVDVHFARDLAQFVHQTEVNKNSKNVLDSMQNHTTSEYPSQDGADINKTAIIDAADDTQVIDEVSDST